jgi:creatinine amidohydrolase
MVGYNVFRGKTEGCSYLNLQQENLKRPQAKNQSVTLMRIAEMAGADFERLEKRTVLLPIGAVERHGDHLPLGTDGFLPEHIARKAAEKLGCPVLPTLWYGSCKAMKPFAGTFDLDSDCLYKFVRSLISEVNRNGFRLLCIVNGHGGNATPLSMAARDISSRTDLSVMVIDWWRELGLGKMGIFQAPGHAGEDETSAMLALQPELVKMEWARAHTVDHPRFRLYSRMLDRRLYSMALTGDARTAKAEKGAELLEAAAQDLARAVLEAQNILRGTQ